MLRAHVQSFLQTSNLMFLLVRVPSFRYPKSMFILINAEMTPKMRERSERAKNFRVFFTLYVTFGAVLYEIEIFNKSFKFVTKLYITFLLIIKFNTVFRNLDEVHFLN